MGLRDRTKKLERRASEHACVLRCPECGEEVRDVGDLPLKVLAAQWQEGTGQERCPDPAVDRVLNHPHEELIYEALRDFPGMAHAE